jgi:hypothetical protein
VAKAFRVSLVATVFFARGSSWSARTTPSNA